MKKLTLDNSLLEDLTIEIKKLNENMEEIKSIVNFGSNIMTLVDEVRNQQNTIKNLKFELEHRDKIIEILQPDLPNGHKPKVSKESIPAPF